MFPDARVVACIRDPRDFLVSYRDKWTISAEGARLRRLYHPVLTSYLWKASARAILDGQSRFGSAIHLLRYEDLVGEPDSHLRQLCAFIGEDSTRGCCIRNSATHRRASDSPASRPAPRADGARICRPKM